MIKSKEIITLIIALIFLSFSNSLFDPQIFLKSFIFFAIILIVYSASKKLIAYSLEAEEETKIWTFQRFGLPQSWHFKYPIPIGLLLSFALPLITFAMQVGFYIPWFAVTESEIKALKTRAAKKHDVFSFSEMSEFHFALICSGGIIAMFIISIIAYLLNFSELARLSIYYACFNLLPLGNLDGTRIFFGSRILYIVLAILGIIGIFYSVFL